MAYPLTCVTGFWPVPNKHGAAYTTRWFRTTLRINCPYVVFCAKGDEEVIRAHRGNLPTVYVECALSSLRMYARRSRMRTDAAHCPSAELNVIWNEKIFLIQKALELNPFGSEFFCWADAGLCTYRDKDPPTRPFPDPAKLYALPKDRLIYTSSAPYTESNGIDLHLHHHVSGTYLLHASAVDRFATLYDEYVERLLDERSIWTDQVMWTQIYKDHPHLFFELCAGYGALFEALY
jgi:hypothetical protein